MIHTHFPKNAKVIVVMKDGSNFVDRVMDSKSNYWFFKMRGKFPRRGVRSIVIYRG